MQLWRRYLRERKSHIAVGSIVFIIFYVSFILYKLPIKAVLYPAVLSVGFVGVVAWFDFMKVKRRHDMFQYINSLTDIIQEEFPKIEGIGDADYQEVIRLIHEEHNTYVTSSQRKYSEMVDYYTVWAHQIKTPIASMRLHLQNEDSALSRTLSNDLFRVEQYVEMVLTFLRLNSESTDYVIKEYNLDNIIRQSVKKYAGEFIERKLSLIYQPVNINVLTDEKWLFFVIEQVLSNALKYTASGSITITCDENKRLCIEDTGIGIAASDIPRIFENGYTGFNGRLDKRASGIGLYLCKRICARLGHDICVESEVDVGTKVWIELAKQNIQIE